MNTKKLQAVKFSLNASAVHGTPDLSPAGQSELIIQQNLFWSAALFYAIEDLTDSATFGDRGLRMEEHFNAIGYLAAIGKMMVSETHAHVEALADLSDNGGDEK